MYLDRTDGLAVKWLKAAFLKELTQINDPKRVSQIRLIRTELQHCLLIADDRIRCFCHLISLGSKFFKRGGQHFLANTEYILLRCKAHLEIKLIELSGRTVSSRILIAEARCDLEIFVKARYHQKLLILLRCLRQCIEFSFKFAARHDIVSGALGGRCTQDRCLDL